MKKRGGQKLILGRAKVILFGGGGKVQMFLALCAKNFTPQRPSPPSKSKSCLRPWYKQKLHYLWTYCDKFGAHLCTVV